jgi:hypothetical protein
MNLSRYEIITNLLNDKLLIKFVDTLSEDIYEKLITSDDIEKIEPSKFARMIERCKQNDPDYQIETNHINPNQLAINVRYSNDIIDVNYPILLNKKNTNTIAQNKFVCIGRIVCIEMIGENISTDSSGNYTQESLNNIKNVTEEFIQISVQTDTIDLTILPNDTYDATANITKFYKFEINSTINFNETFPNLKNIVINHHYQLKYFCSQTYLFDKIEIYFNNNIESVIINSSNNNYHCYDNVTKDIYYCPYQIGYLKRHKRIMEQQIVTYFKLPNIKILKYNFLRVNDFSFLVRIINECSNIETIHARNVMNTLNKIQHIPSRQTYQTILNEIRTLCRDKNIQLTLT